MSGVKRRYRDQKLSSQDAPAAEKEPEFTLVQRKKQQRTRETKASNAASEPTMDNGVKKRRRLPKSEVVVLDKPAGKSTYADMVKEVKATVREQGMAFDITTRRSTSGNVILEVLEKENADNLAETLRRKFGFSKGVRRPVPSISLILIGIEDSVDEEELGGALESHDSELTGDQQLCDPRSNKCSEDRNNKSPPGART